MKCLCDDCKKKVDKKMIDGSMSRAVNFSHPDFMVHFRLSNGNEIQRPGTIARDGATAALFRWELQFISPIGSVAFALTMHVAYIYACIYISKVKSNTRQRLSKHTMRVSWYSPYSALPSTRPFFTAEVASRDWLSRFDEALKVVDGLQSWPN